MRIETKWGDDPVPTEKLIEMGEIGGYGVKMHMEGDVLVYEPCTPEEGKIIEEAHPLVYPPRPSKLKNDN